MMIPACFKHQTSLKKTAMSSICLTDLLLSHVLSCVESLVLVNLPIESSAWGVPRSSVVSSTGTSAVEAGRNDKIVILRLGNILMHFAYSKILYTIIIYIYIHTINYFRLCLPGGLGWWFGSLGIHDFMNLPN